jgi:hypothetical protein
MKRNDTQDLIPTGARPEMLSEAMVKVAARRWQGLTPEERSACARKMALARWGRKKKPA